MSTSSRSRRFSRRSSVSREFGQFFEVLGLMEAETEEEMRQ